jgi:hypothetical protein
MKCDCSRGCVFKRKLKILNRLEAGFHTLTPTEKDSLRKYITALSDELNSLMSLCSNPDDLMED